MVTWAILLLPASAVADSISLSVTPAPVQEVTSEVSWAASSEAGTLAVVVANDPGIPCAADPAGDNGDTLTPAHLLEGGQVGDWSGSVNFTPPSSGTYTLCGWLEEPAGLIETDGGPVTASTSLPIEVRVPRIALALRFARRPEPRRLFTLDLTASSEVARHVVVEGLPRTNRGCPVNYAAGEEAAHIIDTDVTGGPWLLRSNIAPMPPGRYTFCAWADPPEDGGLYPQASTSLALNLGVAAPHRRHRPRKRH